MPGLYGLFAYENYASAQQPVIFFGARAALGAVARPIHGMRISSILAAIIIPTSFTAAPGCNIMIRMVATRLASSSLSIVILVTLVFFMAHLTPGGPAYSILGRRRRRLPSRSSMPGSGLTRRYGGNMRSGGGILRMGSLAIPICSTGLSGNCSGATS